MKYSIVKRDTIESVPPGPASALSVILEKINSMGKDDAIVIESQGERTKRTLYNRMRSNVSKWKTRYGLKHVSVHLLKNGNVAIYRDRD